MNNTSAAMKISFFSIIVNGILSAFKFAAGIIASSRSMVSDAIHSAGDLVSTIIVMVGIHASSKDRDRSHQYGHEKIESVAGIILSVLLCMTGFSIGLDGAKRLISGEDMPIPGVLAMWAAIISIVVKEIMYRVTISVRKKTGSSALAADAWHHRSDAFSSIGSFAGILRSRAGFAAGDSIACIVICFFILKASYDIFKEAMDKLVDKSADPETQEKMKNAILSCNGVISLDQLRTRLFGNGIYVDVEISADGNLSLFQRHEIAEAVHASIESGFENVRHCMVHVNPALKEKN